MSTIVKRVSRTILAVIIIGLLLINGFGCTTAEPHTAKSLRVNPAVEQARKHGHTPWRYRGIRGQRTISPRYPGQKPIFACEYCDNTTAAVKGENVQ